MGDTIEQTHLFAIGCIATVMVDESGQTSKPGNDPTGVATPGQKMIIPEIEEHWPEFQQEIDSMAHEYRDDGWEVVEVHPGDVVPIAPGDHDRWGIDVVVPNDELATVQNVVTESTPDQLELFRSTRGELVFQLVVAKDPDDHCLVLIPTYYSESNIEPIRAAAFDRGIVQIHLRPLKQSPVITFSHEEPAVFFPSER